MSKGGDYADSSIDIWFQGKSLFFPVSSTSVGKDLSIIEDSLMGSGFSIQPGFPFLLLNIKLHKECDRK